MDFILRSERVLLPEGLKPAAVHVRSGKIAAILNKGDALPNVEVVDCGTSVLMPGIVDTHAHINEPGRTEWEGFQTATRAAAAGGITTVIDMPLNSIPATVTRAALEEKAACAQNRCTIDYGFWGGLIPGNSKDLVELVQGGVIGVKCFLIDSGVDEFPMVTEKDLREGMPILAKAGVPLIVHAEVDCGAPAEDPNHRKYESYLRSRPQAWETQAIRMMIGLMRETGCRCAS